MHCCSTSTQCGSCAGAHPREPLRGLPSLACCLPNCTGSCPAALLDGSCLGRPRPVPSSSEATESRKDAVPVLPCALQWLSW